MSKELWTSVDTYFEHLLLKRDDALEAALAASDSAGLPPHHVAANQGMLLSLLVQIQGARRILEIGTLGAYSTIWLARALPTGGRLVTLEASATHASVARSNLVRAGLGELVELREGRAIDSLSQLIAEEAEPFDFVFIDADKPSNVEYLDKALRLTRPGSLIVADNVVRDGAVVNPLGDANVQGVREFLQAVAANPRLSATAIQTVGSKGYDGFAIVRVGA